MIGSTVLCDNTAHPSYDTTTRSILGQEVEIPQLCQGQMTQSIPSHRAAFPPDLMILTALVFWPHEKGDRGLSGPLIYIDHGTKILDPLVFSVPP
jgi:hypothetical protein